MKSLFGFIAQLLYIFAVFSLAFVAYGIITVTIPPVAGNLAINIYPTHNVEYAANLYQNGFMFIRWALLLNIVVTLLQLSGLPLIKDKLGYFIGHYRPIEVCFDLIALLAYISVAGIILILLTGYNGLLFDLLIYGVLLGLAYPIAVRLVKHVNSTVQFTLPGGILIE